MFVGEIEVAVDYCVEECGVESTMGARVQLAESSGGGHVCPDLFDFFADELQ